MNCMKTKIVPVGENPEEIVNLPSAEDLCKILIVCREAGVSEIEYGPVKAHFHPPPATSAESKPLPTPTYLTEEQGELPSRALVQDELEIKEREMEELMITNPLEFERLQAEGELEDESSSSYSSGSESAVSGE